MSPGAAGQIILDLIVNRNGFDRQISGIQRLAKKTGAVLAGAFAVKKIVDFGRQCLELGSDLAEVQNVVDVTFPHMTGQVDQFAKSAATAFGLSETMAKKFTGTFGAMAKSFGFSEGAAYEMSAALTGLTGDVASFYNISQDEAYTKLKSVFTGETESLKDLGVVMTQSALDAYALSHGYGKVTQKMSEGEKVALRYAFVQDRLSAASGDFARTAGGWANQVRIMKLQFDSLKASIGQGLINLFTPAIKMINVLLGKLATLANAFKSFTELITGNKSSGGISGFGSDAAAGLADAADSASSLEENTSGVGSAAKKAAKEMKSLMGFDQINKLDAPSGNGADGGGGGMSMGEPVDYGSLAEGDTVLEQAENRFDGLIRRARELAGLFREGFTIGFGNGLEKIASIQRHIQNIKEGLKGIFTDPAVTAAADGFWDAIALNAGKITGSFASIGLTLADVLLGGVDLYLQSSSGYIKDRLVSIFDVSAEIADLVGEFCAVFADIFDVFRSDEAKQCTASVIGIFSDAFLGALDLALRFKRDIMDAVVGPITENKDRIKQALENTLEPLSGALQSVHDLVKNTFEKLRQAYEEHLEPAFEHLKSGISEVLSSVLDAYNAYLAPVLSWIAERFRELVEDYVQPLINAFIDFAAKAVEALSILWEFISPFVAWFREKFIAEFASGLQWLWTKFEFAFSAIAAVVQGFLEILSGILDFLIGVFTGDWDRAWQGIREIFSGIMDAIFGVAKSVWNLILNTVETVLNGINNKVQLVLGAVSVIISGVWEVIRNVTQTAWNGIKRFIEGPLGSIKRTVDSVLGAVKNKFSTVFGSLSEIVRAPVNKVIRFMNGLISAVATAVNSVARMLNHLKIDAPQWVTDLTGVTSLGFQLPEWTPPQIPYLAQGGFVKKNTPQLAMIGDNRHQGEVVAPEDKLQAMVDSAVASVRPGVTREELEAVMNQAVMRLIAALSSVGFYLDGEQLATLQKVAQAGIDRRYNTVDATV